MPTSELYQLHCDMHNRGISFYYNGYLSEDMLVSIGDALRRSLIFSVEKKRKLSAFPVFIEQIQNIIRYSAERKSFDGETELSFGTIAMGKEKDCFYISSGNKVTHRDAQLIKDTLVQIKKLDRAALKTMLKKRLQDKVPEGSKGAGVGFIEIALRAKQGFEYNITELDSDYSFFCLKVFL